MTKKKSEFIQNQMKICISHLASVMQNWAFSQTRHFLINVCSVRNKKLDYIQIFFLNRNSKWGDFVIDDNIYIGGATLNQIVYDLKMFTLKRMPDVRLSTSIFKK